MRKDSRTQLTEELAQELLDAALANHHGAEPRIGLEERVLANMRQQPRAARPVSWKLPPVMMAAAAVLMFFAVDRLVNHSAVSDPAVVARSEGHQPHGSVESRPDVGQTQPGGEGVVADGAKRAKAAAASKWEVSAPRRRNLALNLNSRRADEQAEDGLQVEGVRIAEVRLDDIVISNHERRE